MPARRRDLVLRAPSGMPLCTRGTIAATPWQRLRGLLGRDGLAAGEGLLLPRTRSVHTCGMRIAIDVVFLDADDVVVRVVAALPPWRQASCRAARTVLELPGGAVARTGVTVGDRLARGRA